MAFSDDQMAKDWEKISSKYAVEDEVAERPAEPEPDEEAPAEEAPAEEKPESDTPARDASGKFVKGKSDEPAEKPEKDAPAKPRPERVAARPAAEPAERGAVPRDTARAPSSWRPQAREGFDKLPEAVRAEIHRRESDFAQGQAQLLPDAQLGREMRSTIEPYRMLIEAEGGTPARAVEQLLRTAAIFRVGTPEQKWQAYAQVGRQFLGIDLQQLLAPRPGQPAPNGAQPNPGAFRDPRVDQLLARQAQNETAEQARTQAQLEGVVTRFLNEADTAGNPKRPYLADVINEMSALIPQIREANPSLTYEQALDEGYQRAIWAHPEIRPLLQRQAAAERDAARRTENQERVRAAKRAASVNVPRRASVPGLGKPGSMDETIGSEARKLGLIS